MSLRYRSKTKRICGFFKFSDSCASFVLINGEVYEICSWFGGQGFVNAVPCDFDADGNVDLLVSSSSGSGVHVSVISVFNSVSKESTVIYRTSAAKTRDLDLLVGTYKVSSSSKDISDLPVCYGVYRIDIKDANNDFPGISYTITNQIGNIVVEDGMPVFHAENQ